MDSNWCGVTSIIAPMTPQNVPVAHCSVAILMTAPIEVIPRSRFDDTTRGAMLGGRRVGGGAAPVGLFYPPAAQPSIRAPPDPRRCDLRRVDRRGGWAGLGVPSAMAASTGPVITVAPTSGAPDLT